MSQLTAAARFAARLYGDRLSTAFHGYVRRDPMARLETRPGRDDPYRIYQRMRATGPMCPTRLGNWAATSHPVCQEVLRDRRFGVRPLDAPTPAEAGEEMDLSFLDRNPPDHARLRKVAAPAFSPRQMAGYQPMIDTTIAELLDRAATKGAFDLTTDFAAPLPIAVITTLLGVPNDNAAEFARHGALIGGALDGIRSLRHARELMASDARLHEMFERLFELRRREPADDVVSRIVAAEGDQVSSDEMLPMCSLLLVAGFETTVNLIGNGVLALLRNRDQWRLLVEDPALAPRVVEEVLRFDPPVQRTARFAFEDVEIAGRPVRKDQIVVTLIGAANRDPEVYREPDAFDVLRRPEIDHLAFSAGIHYCLGSPLARMEAAAAFAALAERLPGLRLAGPPIRRTATTIRGPLHLPVSSQPARAGSAAGR